MKGTLIAVLIAETIADARADALRVFPGGGQVEIDHDNACGTDRRDDLLEIVAKMPIIIVHPEWMSMIVENFQRAFYAKRCDRDLVDVPPKKGAADRSPRHFAFWDEPRVSGTFVVIVGAARARRRANELVMIRRKDTPTPCFERWVGIAEVQ